MIDIKLWSKGDDLLYQATNIAIEQGELKTKQHLGLLDDWEREWFFENVNKILTKYELDPVETFEEALSYSVILSMRLKGQEMLEKYGRQVGALVGDY